MKYNEQDIDKIYNENLIASRHLLSSLPIAEGRKPNLNGLNGWVFEQTIRYCLCQELMAHGLSPMINEQVSLGRKKIDLLVGKLAVEIKARGSFGKDSDKKYERYKPEVEKKGWKYCYLTGSETYKSYRSTTESIFGKDLTFFLDSDGDWARFVNEVINAFKEKL